MPMDPGAGRVPLTTALLRLDPMFDPLRNGPRLEKLPLRLHRSDWKIEVGGRELGYRFLKPKILLPVLEC